MTASRAWYWLAATWLCLAISPIAGADSESTVVTAPAPAPAPGTAPRPKVAAEPWTPTGNEDGILTFKREVPGSPVIALRGEGVINAPIIRVASVVLDNERAPEWVDSMEEVRIVRMLGPTEFIEYDHIGTPPLLADRDFVCRGKIEVDLAAQVLTMSIEPATDPAVPPLPKLVRGRLSGYWQLKSLDHGRKTYVITEMHGDPKGSIPKWLVNFFQKGWPHNTLESLRKQVAKADIKIMPEVKAVFDGKPPVLATGRP